MKSIGAFFSFDRLYRYSLYRIWNDTCPVLVFVLLNPSTADELRDDPTVKRCIARAMNTGFGGIEIVNLFAWRSMAPTGLLAAADPVGPQTNRFIMQAVGRPKSLVICGWGTLGKLRDRDVEVLDLIVKMGAVPHALKLNEDGSPHHPLYLSYKLQPFPIL